jgi:hypothetical protein
LALNSKDETEANNSTPLMKASFDRVRITIKLTGVQCDKSSEADSHAQANWPLFIRHS